MIKLNRYNYLVLAHAVKNGATFKVQTPKGNSTILVDGIDGDGDLMFTDSDGDRQMLNPERCAKLEVLISVKDFWSLAERFDQDNVQSLVSNLTAFHTKNEFAIGDLVQWKAGLISHKMPAEGQTAIVTEVLDEPLRDDSENITAPYFSPKYDLKIGIMDNGDFIEVLVDSRRFEPVKN